MSPGPEDQGANTRGSHGHLRVSHADREHVIGLLKTAYVQGRLSRDEFDRRVSQGLSARTWADLDALTGDIPRSDHVAPARHRRCRPGRAVAGVAAAIASVALVLVVLLPGGGPRSATPAWPSGLPLAMFRGDGLEFSYPAAWRYQTQPWPSDGTVPDTLIALLSPSRLRQYCHWYHLHDGGGGSCRGGVLAHLPPRGVVVTWLATGSGPVPGEPAKGPHTVIAGLPAKVTQDNGASCRYWTGPGAQASINAAIWTSAYTWYSMSACLRGPGLSQEVAEVYAMLHSVRRTPRPAATTSRKAAKAGTLGLPKAPSCGRSARAPTAALSISLTTAHDAFGRRCYYAPAGQSLTLSFTNPVYTLDGHHPVSYQLVVSPSRTPAFRPVLSYPGSGVGSLRSAVFVSKPVHAPDTGRFRVRPLAAGTYDLQLMAAPLNVISTLVVG